MFSSAARALGLIIATALLSWSLATAAVSAPVTGDVPGAAQPLEKGKAVERALSVGEVHQYQVELAAGQLVTVQLKRFGVALVATLIPPGDQKSATLGSSYAREGEETVSFQAETSGGYRIELRTFLKPNPPGRYQIKLLEVRTASSRTEALLARQATQESCREKDWLDGQGAFQVKLILNSIVDCMSAVGDRVQANHPQTREVVAFTKAEVGFLNSRWHWGEPISAAYQKSLSSDFKALAYAAERADKSDAYAIMRAVSDDVKIKADHCSKSTRGLGKDVTVSVTTVKGDKEAPGWVVYYKLNIYEFTGGQHLERFPRLSSPTREELPPGRYLMWVGTPGQAEGPHTKKQLIEVGGGKSQLDWDLFAP